MSAWGCGERPTIWNVTPNKGMLTQAKQRRFCFWRLSLGSDSRASAWDCSTLANLKPRRYFVTSDVGEGRIQWYAFLALPPGTRKAGNQ